MNHRPKVPNLPEPYSLWEGSTTVRTVVYTVAFRGLMIKGKYGAVIGL